MGTNHDKEIQAKLKSLKKEYDRNEARMRQAAINYENLIAEKDALLSTITNLKKTRAERRRQTTGTAG